MSNWFEKVFACVILAIAVFIAWVVFDWVDALSLKTGVVIGHGHSPSSMQVQFVQSGNSLIPVWTHWPETWSVTIEGEDPSGERKRRTVFVSQSDWEQIQEGTTQTFD